MTLATACGSCKKYWYYKMVSYRLSLMLLRLLRFVLSKIILTLDAIFSPTPMQRATEKQALIDQKTAKLVIYQFEGCPFCVKVRRAVKRMGLKIEYRDAQKSPYREELVSGGGELQVPCLRIPKEQAGQYQWKYESNDIIEYLKSQFV